ncbi:MAG: pitrilysin family protein [Pseudoxanthomonas suwonensis]|nr:pitrilysin family protein [Pseudoxanthomonas suwonensis]
MKRAVHRPRASLLALGLSAALGLLAPAFAQTTDAGSSEQVQIPSDSFTLPNGLRVVVHTDRKAPIVAVNVWYHVGSKDEPSGRSGFAHLFEHLMFQESENHRGEFFEPFAQVGATNQNGTTNNDRTNYFQNVPTTALDMALWMESERMGHLLGAVTQAALDEQRGVVQNEKRQGENQPYGQAWTLLMEAMYPEGHPYRHTVIGSMNDLNAATLEDVKNWFRTWYGPNNAVLVLAGDIDVATAREKVATYFGDIPAGPGMAQPAVNPAKRDADTRGIWEDKVPQPRIYRVWNVAEYGQADLHRLQLLAQLLGGSGSSRLDRRLVHGEQLVDIVRAFAMGGQLGSRFMITADVKRDVDPAKVEAIIDEELDRLLAEGPGAEELAQAQTVFRARFIRGIERIGGFGGKADALAECTTYAGRPDCYRDRLEDLAAATPAEVAATGRRWLDVGSHTLVITPGERREIAEAPAGTPPATTIPPVDPRFGTTPGVDRAKGVPATASFPELKFPQLQRTRLANGTEVILAERHEIPVVQMQYLFGGGFAGDASGRAGTTSFTMNMLGEGAGQLDALAFAARAESLGASLGASAALDGSSAWLSTLVENLDPAMGLFADMLKRPRFDQAAIDRVKATWIADIAQEKARPQGAALRVLPPLLYGPGHPYAVPLSGSGEEATIQALTRDDLLANHARWVRPEQATLVVVGDTTLAELVPVLEKHFGNWRGSGEAPAARDIAAVQRPGASRVYLIDQPGAVQANIYVGQLVPSTRDDGATRLEMVNAVLGGDFMARLNMNLREEKHWSYGARSSLVNAVGQRTWMVVAPVQIDKTAEAMAEIKREVGEFARGERPVTAAELARVQRVQTLSLPGAYETASAVAGTIAGIVRYDRPDDYVFQRKAEIEALDVAQIGQAASGIDPDALTWVVVGDLSQIEAPVRALGLGEVTIMSLDEPAASNVARPAGN